MPVAVEFATKPQLARQMLERAVAAQVPHAWVSGDEVDDGNRELRRWLEAQREAYVLAVSVKESMRMGDAPRPSPLP